MLTGVSLELGAGRALHVAGANGSGKTSLLRVLAGITAPRAGAVVRAGACAFVPEKVALAGALRPREWLAAMHALRGLEPVDWPRAAAAAGLDPAGLDRPSARLSKGQLQRIALLEALRSGAPLLLLDEPFAGLDGEGREWLGAELRARLADGAAVALTDHHGAAAGRLGELAELRLGDAGALRPGAGEARLGDAGAAAAARVTVSATHPDGRRCERAVAEDAVDDLLRTLLADGWHVVAVRR